MGHRYLPSVEHPFIAGFPEAVQSILAHAALSDAPSESKLRVLVVDDDMRIADTTAEVLELAGFDAQAAYTGESALQLAASFRPDCLLTDVVMSGMNGVELAQSFGRMHPNARIILISGQAGVSEILDHALLQGLEFEMYAKPIHPRTLIEEIRKTRNRR